MRAFEEYVRLYAPDLGRFCYKLCGDRYEADDLFQETWTKAIKNYRRYDRSKSFKNWLFAICVNTFRDSRSLKEYSAKAEFTSSEEKDRYLNAVPAAEQDRDAYLDLYDAIRSLPKKHRIVITLYYFKEFSQKEIAEILSIPEGTVASRLNTAKQQLKRRLFDDQHHR
ncbi:MAG: sigma-70 family RNA polymerase sigma factor [Ruminococcus sp.]|nr:sigma-70 family RNA polymerase sigma factor [Ruminococcus sp.]